MIDWFAKMARDRNIRKMRCIHVPLQRIQTRHFPPQKLHFQVHYHGNQITNYNMSWITYGAVII